MSIVCYNFNYVNSRILAHYLNADKRLYNIRVGLRVRLSIIHI